MLTFLPTNQIWRYWSFERFLGDVAQLGAQDIDVWLCNQHVGIDAYGVYGSDRLIALLDGYGMRVRTLTPEQGNPKAYNIASLDRQIQRLTMRYYENVVKLGSLLGVRRISLNGGWMLFDDEPDAVRVSLCTALRRICDMALSKGIEVCLEPLVRKEYRIVTNLEELLWVMKEVDAQNLYATLDVGTIARNGETLSSYFKELGARIGYVHATNVNPRAMVHLGWGDSRGTLDHRLMLDELKAGGYRGDCALEMTDPSYFAHPADILARSLRTLKGCEK